MTLSQKLRTALVIVYSTWLMVHHCVKMFIIPNGYRLILFLVGSFAACTMRKSQNEFILQKMVLQIGQLVRAGSQLASYTKPQVFVQSRWSHFLATHICSNWDVPSKFLCRDPGGILRN